MNAEETKAASKAMAAYIDGASIQVRKRTYGVKEAWRGISKPCWDWATYEYRVEPKVHKIYVLKRPDGHIFTTLGKESAEYAVNSCGCILLDTIEWQEKDA